MTVFNRIISFLTVGISLLTAGSMFVHGMQLDKIGHKRSLALPAALATYKTIDSAAQFTDSAEHTHVERTSLSELRNTSTSRMMPREDSRKYVLAKKVVKGIHPFDGYTLPLN